MTGAQHIESSQRSRSSARELPHETEHDALNEAANMSSYGPRQDLPVASRLVDEAPGGRSGPSNPKSRDIQTQTLESASSNRSLQSHHNPTQTAWPRSRSGVVPTRRLHFTEFTEQLRQQQYFENKKTLLHRRRRLLQKTIALSARLHRVSSWIGDGLVEISEQPDTASFVRLHQHIQDLIDLSYSQWDHELYALDPMGKPGSSASQTSSHSDMLSKLSLESQNDFFDLLQYLRSNPRFLVERFRSLAPSQIVSLRSAPRFHRLPETTEFEYGSSVPPRSKISSQRIQTYSKMLEDYASSLERSNPLAFLLFNMYGTNPSPTDAENRLRLSTWSTVCAELMLKSRSAYYALVSQLLDCFASLYEWRARDSVEMFLMDVLQKGAFLLNHPGQDSTAHLGGRRSRMDPLRTPQAQDFFDAAVRDLFAILVRFDGGFPTGALQFASAVLHRLPLVEHQMEFRGLFFSKWFLEQFLLPIISYPENEGMLLKFHVSNDTRQKILRQLWHHIRDRVHDVYSEHPSRHVDPNFRICVETMVGTVDSVESKNPYCEPVEQSLAAGYHNQASLTISVSEIVQVLEALSPQAMHGSRSDHYTFGTGSVYGQYVQASGRFDRLKNDLIFLLEPGSSVTDIHPCQEQWLQIDIDLAGRPIIAPVPQPQSNTEPSLDKENLDDAQRAALRLCQERTFDPNVTNGSSYRSDFWKPPTLEALFQDMENLTSASSDPVGRIYWAAAVDTLHEKYPLSILTKDDSAVLQAMFHTSKAAQARCQEFCLNMEIQMSVMEDVCRQIRSTIDKCVDQFESLRLKIWYSADVVLSKHYDDAKNIAGALNNMAIMVPQNTRSSSSSLYGRAMSSTSSMFDQPFEDTMNIIKASRAHGGPKKLADKQIELTKTWLHNTRIENFCKGEERIHRFCMEVYTVTRNLVGETLSESPVLWASDLFARERNLYDIRAYSITSAPASTRPASVVSDSMSTTYRSPRQVLRSAESLRMALLEDRRSIASSRINRDCLPPELASSIGSLSRAHSATTAESISSIFSPLPSNTRSLTSASVHSRSASIFNDPGLNRFTDTARAKTKFLEKVRQVLLCLLLSDLGCPVWSLGSETDAMLDSSRSTPAVESRLLQRMMAEALASNIRDNRILQQETVRRSRSKSMSEAVETKRDYSDPVRFDDNTGRQQQQFSYDDERLTDLEELLKKLGQQVDPIEKLAVVEEFHTLSLTALRSERSSPILKSGPQESIEIDSRRLSLDEKSSNYQPRLYIDDRRIQKNPVHAFSTDEIIRHLKSDIARIRPKTLFRDLQYISSFVPCDHTDNTNRGKALLQLGLAALAYKDEVCRSMVDVADRMLSQGSNPYLTQPLPIKVAELWMSAAREGNSVAQRELASLYLSQPEVLPVISSPLFKPSEIFRPDMLWQEYSNHNANTQALCLALHWMQQAAANGDEVAKQKLEERKGQSSIR